MKPNLLPMDLQMFAEGEGATDFTFDDFKAFVESNEEAQKFVQSQSQSAADKQLEAWKQNNLEKIKETTIKLEELQAEFEAEKALRVTSDNKAFVAEKIAGLDWDGDLKDSISQFMLNNLVSSDTEFTKKAVEGFTELLEAINDKHAEAIKNVEMTKAFGNKSQQTNMVTGNQTKSFENPEAALGQKLQAFID